MAEILPSDIGLATFNDVGDVANLQTNAKEIVAAINEVLANSEGSISGEQLYMQGEDNTVIGGGNIIYGSGNKVFGTGNVIIGDNHLVIGSKKIIVKYADISTDWYDPTLKRLYFYYYGDENLEPISAGTKVVFSLQQTWVTVNWDDWTYRESEKIVTSIVDFNINNGYIEVAEMPALSNEPPDSIHTVLDYTYVSGFYIISDEYKVIGNGSVNMGGNSTGVSSICGNGATSSGDYSAGYNFSTSKGYGTFAANSGYAEGSRAFAANQGYAYAEYAAALNNAYSYSGYSCALNYGRTCGRAIKCVSMSSSSGFVTAATGENVSSLVGTRVLVRYKNAYGN